jgi:hypothetical protein
MRRLLESYVQGDYGPAIEALDPDVELWLDPQTFPESGPFRRREAVVARLAEVVSSAGLEIIPVLVLLARSYWRA